MKDAGIHDSIMRRYGDVEEEECGQKEKGSSLNLFDTIFFFIVLCVGIILSIVLFLLEIFWSSWMQSNDVLKAVKW